MTDDHILESEEPWSLVQAATSEVSGKGGSTLGAGQTGRPYLSTYIITIGHSHNLDSCSKLLLSIVCIISKI